MTVVYSYFWIGCWRLRNQDSNKVTATPQSVPLRTEEPSVAALCWTCYLLDVSLREGQLGGDMEHDLPLPEHSEDRLGSCLAVSHIQASAEATRQWRGWGGGRRLFFYLNLFVLHLCHECYCTVYLLHCFNATTVLLPFKVLQGDVVSEDPQELLECRCLFVVAKQFFLRRLAETCQIQTLSEVTRSNWDKVSVQHWHLTSEPRHSKFQIINQVNHI